MDKRRAERTPKLDDRFFEAMAVGQGVAAAAQVAGYSRRAVYDWRHADEAFRERWDEAVAIAIERIQFLYFKASRPRSSSSRRSPS